MAKNLLIILCIRGIALLFLGDGVCAHEVVSLASSFLWEPADAPPVADVDADHHFRIPLRTSKHFRRTLCWNLGRTDPLLQADVVELRVVMAGEC
jgi:hypothetical protein